MTAAPRRLRILHIYRSPSYSGAEAYARDLALAQSRGHEVSFLAQPASPLFAKLEQDTKAVSLRLLSGIGDIDLREFDVILLHSMQELRRSWLLLLLAKWRAKLARRGAPSVIVYSHIWISHSKRDPLHLVPYAVGDRYWCSSEGSRQAMTRLLPVPKKKFEVIRYGRDFKSLATNMKTRAEARAHFRIPQDAVVVGTMARVDKGKGSVELFEAVTDLMQSRNDLYFLMIGPATASDPKAVMLDQELQNTLEKLSPSVRQRVIKVGALENGASYLKAFDLFVLATYKENFALTLLEAMYAGLPCLATDSGGSPDVIHPFSTGWLFLPESTESLRTALLQALEQRERWGEYGENSRKLVSQTYDFDRVVRDIENSLLQLSHSCDGPR